MEMMASSLITTTTTSSSSHGRLFIPPSTSSPLIRHHSATRLLGLRPLQLPISDNNRANGLTFRVLANPKGSVKEVVMVDPSEAKRLAVKQMQQILSEEKFKRQRQIEAINGAWAMIGLTAGLVIEGHTGKSFVEQLSGYLDAVVSFFVQ